MSRSQKKGPYYDERLLAKVEAGAEINKQLYRFQDAGDRDVALRFDLTVPLARFVAQHAAELGMPFKRYHIATVWRGENTQHGRYREFMQCDFDTIGTMSNAADIEVVLVTNDLMLALGLENFRIHVNNRLVLNGLLENLANKEVADRLHISERTVKFHVSNLLAKFGVRRRADLILLCFQRRASGA